MSDWWSGFLFAVIGMTILQPLMLRPARWLVNGLIDRLAWAVGGGW